MDYDFMRLIPPAAIVLLATNSVFAAVLTPITPHTALSNRGRCVTVVGVASVRDDPQRLGLDLDLDGEKSEFLGFIPKGYQQQFPELQNLAGKKVAVSGVVRFYHGRAEVVMTTGTQLMPAQPDSPSNGPTSVGREFENRSGIGSFCG